jgi:uncharacterized protein
VRVVLDTNVLLPALFASGLCEAVLELLLDSGESVIVLSDHIIDEVQEHAAGKFGVPEAELRQAVSFLRRRTEIVQPVDVAPDARPDPDDLPVLGTAIAGRADVLVTGDKELLALGEFEGIPILSPRAFYERLQLLLALHAQKRCLTAAAPPRTQAPSQTPPTPPAPARSRRCRTPPGSRPAPPARSRPAR